MIGIKKEFLTTPITNMVKESVKGDYNTEHFFSIK